MITEFSQSIIQALGWTLLHSLWQISLIGGLWWLLRLVLKDHSPAVRYNWGWVALLSLLFISGSTFYHHFVSIDTLESAHSIASFQSYSFDSTNELAGSELSIWNKITSVIESAMPWIVMGWFLGTALLGIRMMGGYFYLQQLRFREFIPLPSEWENRIPQLAHKMGITKHISIGTSKWAQEPITWGHFKPIVLLPVGLLTSLTPDQIEALIIHELAHIRRSDFLINLIQSTIEILFFYHPVVWWLSHSLRQEREMCCDDFAVAICKDAITYADALTRIQSFNHSPQLSLAMTAIGKKGQLTARIHRLFTSPRRTPSFLQGILAWIVLFGLSSFMWHTPAADERWDMKTSQEELIPATSSTDEKPIIIKFTSQTSPAELDEWVEKLAKMDIELNITEAVYNDRNELKTLIGKINDPICGCNGNFHSASLGEMVITIQRGKNSNLSVHVNSCISDGTPPPPPPPSVPSVPSAPSVPSVPSAPAQIRIRGKVAPDVPAPPAPPSVDIWMGDLDEKPLFIIDGEKYTSNEFEALNISPDQIERMDVLKGESALEKYGEKAKNGVVIITKKKEGSIVPPAPINPPSVSTLVDVNDGTPPLFVVDGKQYSSSEFEALDLNPNMIERVDVFKGESAIKKYGQTAENGVVSITTKKGFAVPAPTSASAPKVTGYAKPSVRGLNLNVFPNPAEDFVNFQFELEAPSVTALRVYDLKGNLVASLIKATRVFKKGPHEVVWKTSGVPAGTYVARIELTGTGVPSQAHEGVVFQIR